MIEARVWVLKTHILLMIAMAVGMSVGRLKEDAV